MRPRKAKTLIPEVAKQTGASEELVKSVVDFYWQDVRKSLSGLKHSRVHITNLGDFTFKFWKLDERIESLERFKENFKQRGLQEIVTRFRTDETLFDLKEMKVKLDEEQQRRDFIKMHKNKTNENNK